MSEETEDTNGPVPFDSPAVERGMGFFETVLLVGRRAVLFPAHVERLLATLRRFELPAPSSERLLEGSQRAAHGLVDDGSERALRLSWMAVGQDLDDWTSWRLDASVRAIPATTLARRNGARAITLSAALQRDTPGMKSTSYASAVLALREARRRGADEGLFVTASGSYLEGASTGLVALTPEGWFAAEGAALPSVTVSAFLGDGLIRRPLRETDLRAGSVLLGSLTLAAPLVTLDASPCAVPAALVDRIAAFNLRLREDPAIGTPL